MINVRHNVLKHIEAYMASLHVGPCLRISRGQISHIKDMVREKCLFEEQYRSQV